MSSATLRWLAACFLLMVFVTAAAAQQGPVAAVGTPAAGPQAGSIAIGASWANCNGIDRVLITLNIQTPAGRVAAPKTVELKGPPALLPTGNWATTITGLTPGDIVVGAMVQIIPAPPAGGGAVPNIAQDIKAPIKVVIP